MPLVDLILSFTKKHSTVYNIFIGAWLELKEIKNVEYNLNRLYECLEYEQTKQASYRCLEYFIENEIAFSIYKLGDVVSRQTSMDFLAKVVSIVPNEYFHRLNKFFDLLFSSKRSEELAVALIYSERAIVFGHGAKNSLIEYVLRFFFEQGPSGEYARACVVYLLCAKETFERLREIGFIEIVSQRINRIYLDLGEDISFYLSLLQFVSYYAKKETDLYRKALKDNGSVRAHRINTRNITFNDRERTSISYNIEQVVNKNCGFHAVRSPLLQRREGEDPKDQTYVVFDLIKFPYRHPIRVYREILEGTSSLSLKTEVISSVMENIVNTEEHLDFIRECIRTVPHIIAPYLVKKSKSNWSPASIFQKIRRMKTEGSSIMIPYVCHVERNGASVVDFLLKSRICDDFIFLFMWVASRETFYENFDQISSILEDHKSFWGDLWKLVLK